ncbi:hypothetical protein HDV01_001073 [Terramyces sp. JEL0728]|nr:hypothetical protein HDV01_001073 [Terramyces sp. JEL0728]
MQGQLTSKSTKYTGIYPSLTILYKEEGIRGFFGGFSASLIGSCLSTTTFKRDFIGNGFNQELSFFVAGGLADTVASVFYVPSEVLKTRLQLQGRHNNPHSLSAHNYRNTYDAFMSIYTKRGLRGLYYGWGATLLRDVPYSAIQFTIYETIKKYFKRFTEDGKLTSLHDLVAGACSGGISGAVTTPLDVVKTYLQTQKRIPKTTAFLNMNDLTLVKSGHMYTGIFSAFRGIYKQNGMNGLFSGVLVRSVWTGSQSMAMFFLYEYFISLMEE